MQKGSFSTLRSSCCGTSRTSDEVFNLPVKLALFGRISSHPAGGLAFLRILKDINPDDYCWLFNKSYGAYSSHLQRASLPESVPNSTLRLPARYHHLPSRSNQALSKPEEGWPRKETPVARRRSGKGLESPLAKFVRSRMPESLKPQAARKLINDWRTVRRIIRETLEASRYARNTARIVKRERYGAILGFSGSSLPFNLPAGYLASRLARVPFYAYLFDDYLYQWKHTMYYRFARLVEPLVLKGAAGVIVPNEFSRDEYQRRYQIEPTVVRNAIEIPEIEDADTLPWPANEGEIRITFTGAVYRANYDAFHNLIKAIEQLGRPEVKLHLYTAQTREELERQNISGPVVYHEYIAPSEVFEVQRKADILFLPLGFDTPIPEVIRTAAPTKTADYLVSRRPILVHVPADSFVGWYFREHQCGVMVDRSDPAMLAQAIERIIEDAQLRREIGERARVRAENDFSVVTARTEFLKVLRSGAKK